MEVKPGYKQTEVGIIPDDWRVITLGNVCNFENGDRSGNYPSPSSFVESGIPFINAGHVADGKIETAAMDYITADSYRRLGGGKVISGDILFCLRGSLGKFGVVSKSFGEGAIASSLIIVRPKSTSLTREFLTCYFSSPLCRRMIDTWAGGAAQPNLGAQDLARFLIAQPSTTSEQHAIAEALSDADALIESLEQLLAKKRQLKQGTMQELLTGKKRLPGFSGEWEVKRLGDVVDTDSENLDNDTNPNFAFNYIALEDVDRGCLRGHSEQVFANAPSRARRKLRLDDVLVSTVRPNLQSHLLFRREGGIWVCSTGFCVVRCRKGVTHPGYVFFHLFANYVNRQIEALLTGSNYPAINSRDVRALGIPFPDYDEQTAIAAVLSDMDAEIAALEAKLAKARQLKQGMMQELLTGRIRLIKTDAEKGHLPVRQTSVQAPAKSHNWQINEAVVISVLAKNFGSEQWPLGRKRYTKLSYLLHRHVERQAQGYLKKAAGPYNPATKYKGPEEIALKNGYVRRHTRDQFAGFVAAAKIGEAERYFAKWYGKSVLAWLNQFRHKSNDELELLATVDMAMVDLHSRNETVQLATVKQVIRNHPEWEAKLDRPIFSDNNIGQAMKACRQLFAPPGSN